MRTGQQPEWRWDGVSQARSEPPHDETSCRPKEGPQESHWVKEEAGTTAQSGPAWPGTRRGRACLRVLALQNLKPELQAGRVRRGSRLVLHVE